MKRAALIAATLTLPACLAHHSGPMPGEPAGTYTQLLNTRVRYIDEGEGPAVVLLHGYASAIEAWAAVRPALQPGHRVIALDLRGFGWSDRPEADYSPEAQAQLVLALLAERGVEQFALVGHSWGASVALAVALSAPKRVQRLVLYDAWVYEEQLPSFFLWSRAPGIGEALFSLFYDQRPEDRLASSFYDPELISEELVERVEEALQRPGTSAAALATARGQHYAELQQRYAEIETPTLLIWGREDRVSPLVVGERLQRQLPNARLEIVPRCGHMPMVEAPAQSTRALLEFLAGEDAS